MAADALTNFGFKQYKIAMDHYAAVNPTLPLTNA